MSSHPTSLARTAPGLVAAALLLVVLGAAVAVLPPGRDQAIFAVVGEVVAQGGRPYADAFDFKPPGVHLVYALAALTGDPMRAAHLLELLAIAIGALCLYRLVRPAGRLAAAVAACHLLAGYLGTLRYWDLAQPEGFAIPCILGSLVAFRRSSDGVRHAVLAGVLLGVAALFKYPLVLFATLLPFVAPPPRPDAGAALDVAPIRVSRRRALGLAALGATIPIALAGIWLAAIGALGALVTIQSEYVPGYTKLATLGGPARFVEASWQITQRFFAERPLLLWPPALGLVLALIDRRRARVLVPALGVAIAFAGVAVQGKFFHYHWIPMLPFLAWLSGLAVPAAAARLAHVRERRIASTLLLVLLSVAFSLSLAPVSVERRAALAYVTGRIDRDALHRSPAFGTPGVGDHAFSATLDVSSEVRRLSTSGDRLFVWGFEPWIYVASGRTPASRFIYTAAFISPWCPPAWTEEVEGELLSRPPEVLVVASGDAIPWVTGVPLDSRQALARYPAIVELLRTRYLIAGEVERFTIFTLAPAAGTRATP